MTTFIFILGAIISAIISALFSESILQGLGKLLSKIDLPLKADIEGIWDVEFTMREGNTTHVYNESIMIIKRLGIMYGYNIPDQNNHRLLRLVEEKKPLRFRGNLIDNRYVTGTWFHPDKRSRFHGSFQLVLELSGKRMKGIWTGYRESKNVIDSGKWIWSKRD